MFFHYNDRYINLDAVASVEPHGAATYYTLYDWDGEAITDVPKDVWRKAVECWMPVLPAAPGFTFVGFAIDDDGNQSRARTIQLWVGAPGTTERWSRSV